MELALAALPGVITSCLLVYVLLKALERQNEERKAHRSEVASAARALGEMAQAQRAELVALAATHTADLAAIHSTHREQIETLLQRIQAPEVAVANHAAERFPADPPQYDLDDDLALMNDAERRMRELAEELAAER